MTWLRKNPFPGAFFAALLLSSAAALWFFWGAKANADDASRRFNENVAELNRLEHLTPYPSGPNLRQMKAQADEYTTALDKLKIDLKTHVMPPTVIAPNEFQSRLRIAMSVISEKARANKVKLPDKFFLGFDEFAAALPSTQAAPLLGQELAQVELLLDILLDARIDALTSFRRVPSPQEKGTGAGLAAATPGIKPAPGVAAQSKLIERRVVEASFVSSQGVARKILNQIASTPEQFYIIRLLQVRNEKEKGPPRDATPEPATSGAVAGVPAAKATPGTMLNFIVGNERVETAAKIEIVKFTF